MRQKKESIFSQKNLISGFIAAIMIMSVLGYMWGSDNSNSMKYKEYEFTRNAASWGARIHGVGYEFNYFPSEVEEINISSEFTEYLSSRMEIDSTSFVNDSNKETIALSQFGMKKELAKTNLYFRTGFTSINKYNISVITCEDATPNVPVVYFKTANVTELNIEENCLVVSAKNAQDFLRLKDRILYGILKVI